VGEVEVSQITIVGVVRSIEKAMTNIQYKVDDMTGPPMDVKHWVDMEDSVDATVIPENTYVKVSGNLRSFQNNRSVVLFSIRQLKDPNEITSHMLEVVQAHMVLSKANSNTGMGGVGNNMNNTTGEPWSGGFQGNGDTISGLTPHQSQVLALIRSSQDVQGINVTQIKQRLSGIALGIIKNALEFLSNEGHIFSTIDEDHYKSTDTD